GADAAERRRPGRRPSEVTSMRTTPMSAELRRRLTAALSIAALAACGAVAQAQDAAGGDALLGVWVPVAAPERLMTAAGRPPPLNAEAAKVHAERLERFAAG